MLWIMAMHYNPKFWDNPGVFNPDRFADKKGMKHRYAWMPFSMGPRQCIGNNLAMMEIKIMLIHLLRKFVVQKDPKSEAVKPHVGTVTQPGPKCSVILTPRHH
jgi:cytochrome P450